VAPQQQKTIEASMHYMFYNSMMLWLTIESTEILIKLIDFKIIIIIHAR
jgi:hypothetical protein